VTANDVSYLTSLYAAGAHGTGSTTTPPSFDAVATHTDNACDTTSPYTFAFNSGTQVISQYDFLGFTDLHTVMASNMDGSLPIYMTELGWATDSAECEFGAGAGKGPSGVSETTQATYLAEAYNCLDQPKYSYVAGGFWFELFDDGTSSNFDDHYGLMSPSLVPKPAYTVFKNESLHGDQLTGGCGNFTGPHLVLSAPKSGAHYSGPLRLTATATDSTMKVSSITMARDGKTILHFNSTDATSSDGGKKLKGTILWIGAKRLTLGVHTISATAVDAQGVPTTISVIVDHVLPPKKKKKKG
jgi:hypothetical protein